VLQTPTQVSSQHGNPYPALTSREITPMKMNAIQIRPGNVLDYENKLMLVTKIDIIQPGKGNAVIQVEMKDVRTGVKSQNRWRTQETVERVRLDEEEMNYLFGDDDGFTFMDNQTFEQIIVPKDVVGDQAGFLQEGMTCSVTLFEGTPLSIELPQTVTLEVIEAEPVVKGQTASSSYKPAIVEGGIKVMVPPHIGTGTRIVINTAEGTYLERAKD